MQIIEAANPLLTVTSLSVKPGYILSLTFSDGSSGEVCLKDRLHGPVFAPLRDPDLFAQAYLDYGVVCWPNNADLAPESLHARLLAKQNIKTD